MFDVACKPRAERCRCHIKRQRSPHSVENIGSKGSGGVHACSGHRAGDEGEDCDGRTDPNRNHRSGRRTLNDEQDADHQGCSDGDLNSESFRESEAGRNRCRRCTTNKEGSSKGSQTLGDKIGGEQSPFQLPVSPKGDANSGIDVGSAQWPKDDDGEGDSGAKRQGNGQMARAEGNTSTSHTDHEGRAEELARDFPAHGDGFSSEVQSLHQEHTSGNLTW